jgi:serine/threonine protein kinase
MIKANAVHRDLKPENVLIKFENDSIARAYLADLGTAKIFDTASIFEDLHTVNTLAGTIQWTAPEILGLKKNQQAPKIDYSKIDVFSLGLLSLFCLDSHRFQDQTGLNHDPAAMQNYLSSLNLHPSLVDLLTRLLSFDPATRPSIKEIYNDLQHFIPIFSLDHQAKISNNSSEDKPVNKSLNVSKDLLNNSTKPDFQSNVAQEIEDKSSVSREKIVDVSIKNTCKELILNLCEWYF